MNTSELVCNLDEDSRIKVVGLGGIGCIVLQYLTVFLKSLDRPLRLVLIDGDRFEVANNRRMIFQTVGNKAEVKAAEIVAWLGPCEVSVVAVPQYLTVESIEKLILPGDHVFLFSGGNEGVDPPRERGTYGNVQVYLRRDGRDVTASLTRFHPEIANPKGKLPTEASCVELAASTPQILFTNLAVASAMLNAFFAHTCGRLEYQEVKLDVLDARMLPQM
jgi:hypothetical protein